MAINLSDNILSKTTAPADAKYGVYTGITLSDALNSAKAYLLPSYRYKGLTVGIVVNSNPIVEYWFKDGILDAQLVIKAVDLQVVTNEGATTTNSITANSFIKSGGTGTNILLDNGTTTPITSIVSNTNLSPTQTATNFTINSDTGTDATIPLGNGTLAGATLNDYTTTEKNKLAGIATGAEVNVNADWNATTGDAQILNKPTLTNLVPYTGATTDVNLGLNDITAAKLIKDGGFDYQFLKADGSVDNNTYLTSADLPSTLDLYATTTASNISGYTVLVRNISDTRYNATAVDVSTGVITSVGQLVGSLVTDANIISGNPGVFDFKTIGNIRRTNGTGQAEFFFRIYKRNLAGTETLIAQSDYTLPVTNGGYVEFSATALWNDGIFLETDRVVLKYYANRLTSPVGSDPTYQFQFGGASPVRSSAAIPTSVMPNIYLRDLADVENVDALNNEILYWNDPASLWEHSLAENLVPLATSTQKGLVSTTTQTFAGDKIFTGAIEASNLKDVAEQSLSGTGMIATGGTLPSGTQTHSYRWSQVGNLVTVRISLQFSTLGTCSGIAIPFANMSDIPQIPQHPTIYATALDVIAYGSGQLSNAKTFPIYTFPGGQSGIRIKTIGSPNTYEFLVGRASSSYQFGWINIQYYI